MPEITQSKPFYCKVFGERNTGTNVMFQFLKKNTTMEMFSGVFADVHPHQWKFIKRFPVSIREILIDWLYCQNEFTLSYKHRALPEPSSLQIPNNIVVILMLRNPISWLMSLYKNPYHLKCNFPKDDISNNLLEFSTTKFKTRKRENLNSSWNTPIEIWQEKVRTYRCLVESSSTPELLLKVRFEDFVSDQVGWAQSVDKCLPFHDQIQEVISSTKGAANKTSDYYADYYLHERWREVLTSDLFDALWEQFDKALVEWAGYVRS